MGRFFQLKKKSGSGIGIFFQVFLGTLSTLGYFRACQVLSTEMLGTPKIPNISGLTWVIPDTR